MSGVRGIRAWISVLASVCFMAGASVSVSMDPPHDIGGNIDCKSCHMIHASLGPSLTAFATNENLCLSCHTLGNLASGKPLSPADQAVPGISGTSHRWDATMPAVSSPDNPYGLRAAADVSNTGIKSVLTTFSNIATCSVCHEQHIQTQPPWDPNSPLYGGAGTGSGRHFQRIDNSLNQICEDCHYYRTPASVAGGASQTDVRTWSGNHKSHPVTKVFSSAQGETPSVSNPTQFNAAPLEPQSAAWAPQAGPRYKNNGGPDTNPTDTAVVDPAYQVRCLSCHGVHYTDSSSSTVDQPGVGAGDGLLLRRAANEICEACHKTERNTPSPGQTGYVQTNWDNAVKTHSSDYLGTCSISTYKTKEACAGGGGTWTPGKWGAAGGWGSTGGKYGQFTCTTCHSAHNTSNVFLVRETLNTPDGSTWGSSGSTSVSPVFKKKQISGSPNPGVSDGVMGNDSRTPATSSNMVCEVCHSQTNYHKYNQSTDYHHENSNDCTSCHKHSDGFKTKGGCIVCHSLPQGNRAAVVGQFSSNSHHVQGASVTDDKCYQCHWEANSDGSVNLNYHTGAVASGSPVNLVVYGSGARPTTYALGVTAVEYTANGSRTEIQKVTTHCLGCHSDQNDATVPFGDGKTPKQYAWDGTSVAARYSQTGTTIWGKYVAAVNSAPKNLTKAYSAHGNLPANQRGWNTTTGVDGSIVDTGGNTSVQCFDCHNSHGSSATGTTTRYTSATTNGGILKDTTAGQGGYSMTYQPQAGGSAANKNIRNAGASLCLDCHLTQTAGTTPWGYNSTFGATQQVLGYWDSPFLAPGNAGPQQRFPYKGILNNAGGHFGASAPLSSTPMSTINGLCTPCHDPHGVSPTLGADQQYGVPLLKGTWMTSPYKEDVAPANNVPGTLKVEGVQYHIDQNTFSTDIRGGSMGITEMDTQFAGLCLTCHAKASLTDGVTHTWKSKDRIHESVRGWKTADVTIKHNYTCSKCHTPHNGSALPRLMVTNCMNSSHKGRMSYNIAPATSGSGSGDYYGCYGYSTTLGYCGSLYPSGSSGLGGGRMPGSWSGTSPGNYSANCHEGNTGSVSDQSWNVKTPWAEDVPIITSGPSAGSFTAVGTNVQATVTWQTSNSYSTSYVDYGLTTGYGSTTGSGTLTLDHSVLLQNLANHSTYHYRVRSTSSLGNETASGDNTFYISMPPTVPSPIHKTNETCAASCSVILQWNASTDPDGGSIQYNVQASTDSTFATVDFTSGWISDTSVTTSSLSTNNTYYWRVQARDGNHTTAQDPASAWSSADSFMVSDGLAPGQIVLTSPADGTGFADLYCGGSPTIGFLWNAAPPLAQYDVQVSTDSTFTTVNYESGWISTASWSAVITPGFTYYWRVQAWDSVSNALSPWSLTWSFSVTDWGCPKSSCPFVFVWDGEKFAYVTDLQGEPIGYAAGSYMSKWPPYFQPLYVVLDSLKPDLQGKYQMKLRETLPEISYLDEAKLLAVDFPAGYELASSTSEMTYRFKYTNPFKLYTLRDPRPPVSAVDQDGADVRASIVATDGNLLPMQVFALNSYTLDFGQIDPANAKLVIDGWSVFGSQYTTALPTVQPYIEVVDVNGLWVKVKSFGEPAGDMKRMVIDLSGLFLGGDHRIRLNTGRDSGLAWRIDRISIDDSAPASLTITELNADSADLHYRGRAPYIPSALEHRITAWDEVRPDDPNSYGFGSFTKYGDVRTLLTVTDDMFAIMRHGDEISLTFSGPSAPVPSGMQRSFVLKTDVYYKTFRVDRQVGPLPFHSMSTYPYDLAVEHYPDDGAHRQYLLEYNTRVK